MSSYKKLGKDDNFELELTYHFEDVRKGLEDGIKKALTECGLLCEGYAKLKCPVDTGRLRNSITKAVRVSEKTVYIGTNVEYAEYVEEGTYKQKAQPYLKPAVADHTSEYQNIVENCLKN